MELDDLGKGNKTRNGTMAKGDQIYVWRSLAGLEGVYEHHGIDCGDRTVIHYSKRGETPTVTRTHIDTFVGETDRPGRVQVKRYTTCYIPETVVRRAESRLGEQQYNVIFNNCEHFATWCKTGVHRSIQIGPLANRFDLGLLDQALGAGPSLGNLPGNNLSPVEALNRALDDLERSWNRLQPQYKEAKEEFQQWDQVAQVAIQRGRDDLAKGAIAKKLAAKKRLQSFGDQLSQLAKLTEKLVDRGQNLGIDLRSRRSYS